MLFRSGGPRLVKSVALRQLGYESDEESLPDLEMGRVQKVVDPNKAVREDDVEEVVSSVLQDLLLRVELAVVSHLKREDRSSDEITEI